MEGKIKQFLIMSKQKDDVIFYKALHSGLLTELSSRFSRFPKFEFNVIFS